MEECDEEKEERILKKTSKIKFVVEQGKNSTYTYMQPKSNRLKALCKSLTIERFRKCAHMYSGRLLT